MNICKVVCLIFAITSSTLLATEIPCCHLNTLTELTKTTVETKSHYPLTISEIIKGQAYVVEDPSFVSAYSLLVRLSENEVLVIDTPYTPQGMDAVLGWIDENLGDNQKVTAINTHHHVDCLGGNKALRDKGIDIYATALTFSLLEQKRDSMLSTMTSYFSDNPQCQYLNFTSPNKIVPLKRNQRINLPNLAREITMFFPGHAHSEDNIVVLIPHLNLLFGGCMISCLGRENLGWMGEANIQEWLQSHKNLISFLELYSAIEYVIPGHPHNHSNHPLSHDDFSPKMINETEKLILKQMSQ